MSRLIKIDPEIELVEEEEGREYGYSIFEELPPILSKNKINSLLQEEIKLEELERQNSVVKKDPILSY